MNKVIYCKKMIKKIVRLESKVDKYRDGIDREEDNATWNHDKTMRELIIKTLAFLKEIKKDKRYIDVLPYKHKHLDDCYESILHCNTLKSIYSSSAYIEKQTMTFLKHNGRNYFFKNYTQSIKPYLAIMPKLVANHFVDSTTFTDDEITYFKVRRT